MATVVNDRDVLIMGTSPRFTPPTDRGMFITPTSAMFKVSADGSTASPASYTFQVTLLNMTGAVTFSFSDGMTPTVNGNTVTLSYANMSAVSGVITANVTVDGQLYTAIANVIKVADGGTTYTWVKYADSASGAGLSDDPTGKAYIGLAYNKTTATESTVASDYAWSLIKGTDGLPGAPGADGSTLYTWIKYSDVADGTGLYDVPTASTQYIGLAVNKTTATESTVKTDYVWSKFKGDQGVPGNPGLQGSRGNVDIAAVTAGSIWSDSEASAALAAAGYGAPQVRDLVKLYKSDRTFSVQKMYNGSAWVAVDYVYDGSVFVKGSILPEAIDTRGLTIRDGAGNIILGSGSGLPTAYAAPGTLNSDLTPAINAAANTAVWSSVTGTGKPQDNATVGANASNFAATLGGDNLMNNSGFESIDATTLRPYGYAAYNNGAGSPASYISVAGRTGGKAFAIRANASGTSGASTFGLFSRGDMVDGTVTGGVQGGWQPNKTYVISFKAKKVNGAGFGAMCMQWNSGPSTTTYVTNPTLTTAWQTYTFRLTWGSTVPGVGGASGFVGELYLDCINGGLGYSVVANDEIHIDELIVQEGDVYSEWFLSSREAATQSTWVGTSGRPSDDAIKNNLIDLSGWQWHAAIPWTQNNETNILCNSLTDVGVVGPKGGDEVVWYAKETTGDASAGGGWNNAPLSLDPTKTYRFVIPIRRKSGSGEAYWGIDQVCDLNTTTVDGNPYFAHWGGLSTDRWYLFVGYIYPAGSTGNTHTGAGIWDCHTGQKVVDGYNYTFAAGIGNIHHRAYQYYATPNAEQLFGRPMVNLVDGTEPSLREYFEPGVVLNTMQQWGDVSGTGKPADYATVSGADAATALGFNPQFSDWTGTLPAGWGGWGGAPIKETGTIRTAPNAVKWSVSGNTGMAAGTGFSAPLPAGTFVQGAYDIYIVANNGGGSPGYLIRLYTNAAQTVYTDTFVAVPDKTVSGWQHVPFTARVPVGQQIWGITIYQMASWDGATGGNWANGSVCIFDNLTFDFRDSSVDNNVLVPSINSAATTALWSNIAGQANAPASNATVGATIGTNLFGQMNASNISTFIAAAAINLALIDRASIGSLSALSAVIGTLRTATSGARTEISDNVIKVFDTSNQLRVRLGDLSL